MKRQKFTGDAAAPLLALCLGEAGALVPVGPCALRVGEGDHLEQAKKQGVVITASCHQNNQFT